MIFQSNKTLFRKIKCNNRNIFIQNKNIYKQLFQDTIERYGNSNLEIHIDYLVETALLQNMKVVEIPTDKTVMIGTPIEYELYNYMYTVNNYMNQNQ